MGVALGGGWLAVPEDFADDEERIATCDGDRREAVP
jgi:hypothetical protein